MSHIHSKKNYFNILGLHENCNDNDVKQEYLKLAKIYHPDVNKDHDALERFKDLTLAYDILKNSNSRLKYIDRINNKYSSDIKNDNEYSNVQSHDFYADIRKNGNCSRYETAII